MCRVCLLVLSMDVFVHGNLVPYSTSTDDAKPMSIFNGPTTPALASDLLAMQHSTHKLGRIDTHHHFIPPLYADYLEKYGESAILILEGLMHLGNHYWNQLCHVASEQMIPV